MLQDQWNIVDQGDVLKLRDGHAGSGYCDSCRCDETVLHIDIEDFVVNF